MEGNLTTMRGSLGKWIQPSMEKVIVIGASAGGVTVLQEITRVLPASLPATIIVVMHRTLKSNLPAFLGATCALPIQTPSDGSPVQPRAVYVAPANHHLWLEDGLFRVDKSPPEGFYRPSVNVLFRSAATEYGRRVIGVILSGALNDGAAGLWKIKRRGGVVIVQDPLEAAFAEMPSSALQTVAVDFVLPAASIGHKLVELTAESTHDDAQDRPLRVLIVEDEAVAAAALEDRLRQLGYETIGPARFGEDAIVLAWSEAPDLIVMDIRLAGPMTGIEAARRIWEGVQIPIVYITAFADAATFDQVSNAACYGYVTKPFHTKAVHAAIELALKRRRRELVRR
jgi:chemotaxis response regulator CheB